MGNSLEGGALEVVHSLDPVFVLSVVVIHDDDVDGFHELDLDGVHPIETSEQGGGVFVDMLVVLLQDSLLGEEL